MKPFLYALASVPFSIAIAGIIQKFGLLDFWNLGSWGKFRFIVSIIFGLVYLIAFYVDNKNKSSKD
jgi:hypothetical protein